MMEQRCPHGFIKSQVGCPECGAKEPTYGASSDLRRASERRAVGVKRIVPSRMHLSGSHGRVGSRAKYLTD